MRSFWRNGIALSTALLVCVAMSLGAATVEGQDGDSATKVKAREIAFAKTMADRDFDAFLSFVSAEAIFFDQLARGIVGPDDYFIMKDENEVPL